VNYNHISTRHNRHLCDLGISDQKGLYSWKHSGACALYKVLNGDVYSLMRQLRHHDLNVTQIYLKSLGLLDNAAVRSAVW
jgi:integrase